MPEQAVDIAVVGASAAGIAAAWAAAGEGARVELLEAKAVLGDPPAPAALAFDHLWRAPFQPPAHTVRRRHDGLVLRSPGGRAVEVDAPLSILDRTRFDRWLAQEAQARGASIETGVRDLALASLRARARVLVFADGARSLASTFLPTLRHPQSVAWGAVLAFERSPTQERVVLTLGSHARGGRSQLNPLEGARWSHWTFYHGAPEEAEARARAALALDARLSGWDDDVAQKAEFLGVAPDPVYALPGRISAPGVLVAGGAAGQGGLEAGLGAGLLAGRVAARVARGEAKPSDYERVWRARHAAGHRALREVTLRLANLDDDEVDELLAPWHGKRIHVRHAVRAALANPRGLGALARAALRSF